MATNGWQRLAMKDGAARNSLYRSVLVAVCLAALCACTATEWTVSRPTIASDTDWKVERCVGRLCPRAEEAMVAKDLRVRIETNAGTTAGIFLVTVDLLSKLEALAFDPSAATVTLDGGKTLPATGISCARNGSAAASMGSTHVRQNLCYHLLFDSRPPAMTDEFVVRLNGITRNGATVRVPDIVFRPHVVKRTLGGLLD